MTRDGSAGIRAVARSRVRARWRELVAIGLVAGLIGGVAIAALAGARRTSTAYDRLLAASDHPDLFVQLAEPRPGLADDVAGLPAVERLASTVFAVGLLADAPGQVLVPLQASAAPVADLPVVAGRSPDPSAADEVVLSPRFAEQLGLGVGDVFVHQALTDAEFADLLRDRWDGSASGVVSEVRVVGIVRAPTDVTLSEFPTLTGTPALHDRMVDHSAGAGGLWVHLRAGADVATFEQDLAAVAGDGSEERFNAVRTTDMAAQRQGVDDATAVLSAGLVIFGAVAVLAGSVVLGQLVNRTAESARRDDDVLHDLGVDRRGRRTAWIRTGWPVVVTGVAVAVAVAVVASAWTPPGVARSIEPDPGIEVNLAILGAGVVAVAGLVLGVWVTAAGPGAASGRSPRPAPTRRRVELRGGPRTTVALAVAQGPAERRGSWWLGAAGVGSSLVGIVAAVVFGSSLVGLVDDPSRWGWFGDLSIEVPEPVRDEVYAALDAAPAVDGYAEVRGIELAVEGTTVAAYAVEPRRGDIEPAVLRGRAPVSGDEIALGPRLSQRLGVEIGDRVATDAGARIVVGEAATFGLSERSDNVSGALLGGVVDRPDFTTAIVRVADGFDPGGFGAAVYPDAEYGSPVVPSEVANMDELRALPALLAAVFAVTGLVSIAHLARSTGDRNRRDVAVLRSLGLSRRHAVRSVLTATAGIVLAVAALAAPLGVLAAARVWEVVAGSTDLAAPVALPPVLLWGVPVLVVSAAVAGVTAGRGAVARPPARQLRSE